MWREKPSTSDTSQPQTAHCAEQTEAHYGSPFSMSHQGQLETEGGGEGTQAPGTTIRISFSSFKHFKIGCRYALEENPE